MCVCIYAACVCVCVRVCACVCVCVCALMHTCILVRIHMGVLLYLCTSSVVQLPQPHFMLAQQCLGKQVKAEGFTKLFAYNKSGSQLLCYKDALKS